MLKIPHIKCIISTDNIYFWYLWGAFNLDFNQDTTIIQKITLTLTLTLVNIFR